jgi:hypothetical protein
MSWSSGQAPWGGRGGWRAGVTWLLEHRAATTDRAGARRIFRLAYDHPVYVRMAGGAAAVARAGGRRGRPCSKRPGRRSRRPPSWPCGRCPELWGEHEVTRRREPRTLARDALRDRRVFHPDGGRCRRRAAPLQRRAGAARARVSSARAFAVDSAMRRSHADTIRARSRVTAGAWVRRCLAAPGRDRDPGTDPALRFPDRRLAEPNSPPAAVGVRLLAPGEA